MKEDKAESMVVDKEEKTVEKEGGVTSLLL